MNEVATKMVSTFKKQWKYYHFFRIFYMAIIILSKTDFVVAEDGFPARVLNFGSGWKNQKTNRDAFYPKPKFETLAALFDFWGCKLLFKCSMFKRLRLLLMKMGSTFKKQWKHYRFFRIYYLAVIMLLKTVSVVSEDGFYARVWNFREWIKKPKNNKNAFYPKPKF